MSDSTTTFDESLRLFVAAVGRVILSPDLRAGTFIRNSNGQLAFVARGLISDDVAQRASAEALKAVGSYARQGMCVLSADYPGVSEALLEDRAHAEIVAAPNGEVLTVRLVDQRIVGQDWQRSPASRSSTGLQNRFVFFSVKGGVGRTTALAVAAADLARYGRKVLVVDLDLEAPGVGQMLLSQKDAPRFGMLDAYVEGNLQRLSESFLLDMVAPSPFGMGKGLVDVVPAVGTSADQSPGNVLAKLARAYLDGVSQQGEVQTFLDHTRSLVDQLSALKTYDTVLIDARAGFNESTAAALLGLGAQVLLFGENTPQTFAGYRYLFAHLRRFRRDREDDWLDRLQMVHGKASAEAAQQQVFRDKAYRLFAEWLYQEAPIDEEDTEPVTLPEFSVDDTDAPHFALPILRDSNYFEFDPLTKPSELSHDVYERTYGAFLSRVNPVREALAL